MIKKFGTLLALVLMGLFITLGVPVLAQTSPAPARPNPAGSSSQPVSPSQPRPPQTQPQSNQAQLSAVDQQYMLDANRNAVAAIALGQLALNQATNSSVKEFAQAEMDEQVQVQSNLTRLAPTLSVNLPTAPTLKDQEVQARLSRLSGANFDRAFMNEVGINAHLENAAIYQREAGMGQNRDLVGLATNGLPLITQHYKTASALTGYQVAQVPARVTDAAPNRSSSTPR